MDEQKTQTFAEWLLDYTSTHKNAVVSIEQGPWGDIKIQIRDYSKSSTGIAAQHYITYQIYRTSKLSFDEILITAAEELCKEIENYGNKP